MSKSPIEWTEETWNPIVGCSIVSPGCTHCYAMAMAARNEAMGTSRYDGTTRKVNSKAVWTGKLAQAPVETLLAPLRRRKPTVYFVNSMGDLFHEDCPDEWIDRVFAVMALCPQHTFQVLTKRAARMREYLSNDEICELIGEAAYAIWTQHLAPADKGNLYVDHTTDELGFKDATISLARFPLPNVWLGVSTERQQEADERIPLLLQTPAAVRFISAEPLLGPIDLTRLCILPQKPGSIRAGIHINALTGSYCESGVAYKGDWDITKPPPPDSERRMLDWVIVGGESGPNARPMHPDWARSLREQCSSAGVSFFFKQWGEWLPWNQFTGAKFEDDPEQTRFATREWDGERWNDVGRPMWCDSADGNIDDDQCVGRVGKKRAGRLLDGVEHSAMPKVRP